MVSNVWRIIIKTLSCGEMLSALGVWKSKFHAHALFVVKSKVIDFESTSCFHVSAKSSLCVRMSVSEFIISFPCLWITLLFGSRERCREYSICLRYVFHTVHSKVILYNAIDSTFHVFTKWNLCPYKQPVFNPVSQFFRNTIVHFLFDIFAVIQAFPYGSYLRVKPRRKKILKEWNPFIIVLICSFVCFYGIVV